MFIAFRLKPGRDNDLIVWISNITPGDRSYYIRELMRRGLSASIKSPTTPTIAITPKQVNGNENVCSDQDLEDALDNW